MSNNAVFNYSKKVLTLHEISVLNKGLNFSVSHIKPKTFTVDNCFKRFERSLQLALHFVDEENTFVSKTYNVPFTSNPNWWPPQLNNATTDFCDSLKKEFLRCSSLRLRSNLTLSEKKALLSLRNDSNIVIKKCDKGGGIAILDKDAYFAKVYAMLNDINVYSSVDCDDSVFIKNLCDDFLFKLYLKETICSKQFEFLTSFIPKCPVFFGLPKIHKEGLPLRPIVSQINGPTSMLNKLIDKFLFVAEKRIPFLLQDTTAFLNLIEENKFISPNTFLVTLDVTSLYTNIPQLEGASWVCDFYNDTLNFWPFYNTLLNPIEKQDLFEAIMIILNNCTFTFDNLFFKQNYGTTMGAAFSVKFANIYMHMWFCKYLPYFVGHKPAFIARLVDDCFFLWNEDENSLKGFIAYLNQCHPTIKFEAKYSLESVNFLDTVVFIKEGQLHTKTYIKPTDKKLYLHFNSAHPRHIFHSIPYSQALRYIRINSDELLLKSELESLRLLLLKRGYPRSIIEYAFDKASLVHRSTLLIYKTEEDKHEQFVKYCKGKKFLPLIVPFFGSYKSFQKLFYEKWDTFSHKPEVAFCFLNSSPKLIFNRATTISNLVCSNNVTSFNDIDLQNIQILKELASN